MPLTTILYFKCQLFAEWANGLDPQGSSANHRLSPQQREWFSYQASHWPPPHFSSASSGQDWWQAALLDQCRKGWRCAPVCERKERGRWMENNVCKEEELVKVFSSCQTWLKWKLVVGYLKGNKNNNQTVCVKLAILTPLPADWVNGPPVEMTFQSRICCLPKKTILYNATMYESFTHLSRL